MDDEFSEFSDNHSCENQTQMCRQFGEEWKMELAQSQSWRSSDRNKEGKRNNRFQKLGSVESKKAMLFWDIIPKILILPSAKFWYQGLLAKACAFTVIRLDFL